jgi:hypothetical protein
MFGEREHAMKAIEIPQGASIYLGAPANPMPKAHSDAITDMVSKMPEIEEAHLPQCYLPGVVDPPTQILVILAQPGSDTQAVLQALARGVFDALPKGTHL